jgi:hypothetical protein
MQAFIIVQKIREASLRVHGGTAAAIRSTSAASLRVCESLNA